MRIPGLLSIVVWLGLASGARADMPPMPGDTPVHRVHVIDREAIAGHTLVGVTVQAQPPHGPPIVDGTPYAVTYEIADDFAHEVDRLCAIPSARIVASPVGELGTRMILGAAGASGATVVDDAPNIARTLALFDADDVACVTLETPVTDPALLARHVDAVEDTIRATGVDGRTLHVELVSVAFLVEGNPPIVAAALPGGARPSIPPRARGCGCGVGRTTRLDALALAIFAVALLLRRRTRSSDPV